MSQSDRISRPMCFGTYRKAADSVVCLGCSCAESCIAEENRLEAQLHAYEAAQAEAQAKSGDLKPARSKYHREIRAKAVVDGREVMVSVWLDFYDIAKGWDVRCPALQHALKKILAPGNRGHKDLITDLNDIVASAIRARELEQ